MGYIAPMTQYQYVQYHDRVRAKGEKVDPYPITTVQKVNLNTNSFYNNVLNENTAMTIEKLTGKGRHFSEYV
ncbi:hypothetical protein [Lederbergia panacisoli]|uniref:hypothetical protein n=1 Tax=Lederbergia panacisoli TaxID=1255251 RepID=UPI00214BF420|nr:hypothetical protein [Lederbergia panacisoli]MCR2820965.1 hypothetical protein [Lederbergia panacisoli]